MTVGPVDEERVRRQPSRTRSRVCHARRGNGDHEPLAVHALPPEEIDRRAEDGRHVQLAETAPPHRLLVAAAVGEAETRADIVPIDGEAAAIAEERVELVGTPRDDDVIAHPRADGEPVVQLPFVLRVDRHRVNDRAGSLRADADGEALGVGRRRVRVERVVAGKRKDAVLRVVRILLVARPVIQSAELQVVAAVLALARHEPAERVLEAILRLVAMVIVKRHLGVEAEVPEGRRQAGDALRIGVRLAARNPGLDALPRA